MICIKNITEKYTCNVWEKKKFYVIYKGNYHIATNVNLGSSTWSISIISTGLQLTSGNLEMRHQKQERNSMNRSPVDMLTF